MLTSVCVQLFLDHRQYRDPRPVLGLIFESNNTVGSGYAGFGQIPAALHGVFDVGPVIKPKGGYYTRPELRFFATYAVWSDSLKGMTTPGPKKTCVRQLHAALQRQYQPWVAVWHPS